LVSDIRGGHRLRAFEYRVLRIIFGPKRDVLIGGWRKPHDKLHNLYSSPNMIRMIKSRRMRRAEHVARIGRKGMRIGHWWESQEERAQ
jgi:hypothetical protein